MSNRFNFLIAEINLNKKDNNRTVDESKLLKSLYFWSFIAFGAISPFAGIFYKRVLVLPNGEPAIKLIGYIFAVAPLIGFTSNIVMGIVSDKYQKGRLIITGLSIASAITAIVVAFSGSDIAMSMSLMNRFWVLFTAVLLYRFSVMPINSLLDSETLQYLSKHSDKNEYGRYRIWGTIGWAVVTALAGFMVSITNDYRIVFYIGALGYLIFAALGTRTKENPEVDKIKIPWDKLKNDKSFIIFLSFILIVGIIDNATATYLGYFFDDVIDTPLKIGLIFSLWTTFEIPIMHYSKKLIDKFGNRGLIIAGLVLSALKLYLFSLFTPDTPFVFEILAAFIHGPAFALLYLGTVDIVGKMAHENLSATYMSITAVARYTLAASIGGLVGAKLIELFGGANFMKMSAVATFVMIAYFIIVIKDENKENEH